MNLPINLALARKIQTPAECAKSAAEAARRQLAEDRLKPAKAYWLTLEPCQRDRWRSRFDASAIVFGRECECVAEYAYLMTHGPSSLG